MIPIISTLLPLITDVLKRVIPDERQRLETQEKLTLQLMANETALLDGMAKVMTTDAQSESWLTRNARPIVVMWGLFMVTFIGMFAPAFGIQKEVVEGLAGIPAEMWTVVTTGVGIWFAGRTVEKAIKGGIGGR